jgi:hypothetical protein
MASENLGNPYRSRELPGDPQIHFPVHQNREGSKARGPKPKGGWEAPCLLAGYVLIGGGARRLWGRFTGSGHKARSTRATSPGGSRPGSTCAIIAN